MSESYKQFWIHKGRAYEIINDRSLLEDVLAGPEKWETKVVDIKALESANAENEQLNSKTGKLLLEISQQFKDYVKLHKTNVAYEFKIERLQSENKKLREQLSSANGTIESLQRANATTRAMLESANAEIAALKNHLELMTANRDAYAKAMGIAMEEGIFPHKEITKAKIAEALKQFLKEAGDGK